MKKLFTILLTTILALTAVLPGSLVSVYAAADDAASQKIVSETTEYFEDGSYITVIVTEASGSKTRATTYTQLGSKAYIGYNKDKEEMWRFTIHGTFSVNEGVSATCTAVYYTINITNDAWENKSASVSRSDNQAIGDATFIRKLLGITVETRDCHVVLTCDEYGNLS